MKTFIIDYSKWRCGGSGTGIAIGPDKGIGVGKGFTRMLNTDGYMCCLGQWTLQMHPEWKEEIVDLGVPGHIKLDYEFVSGNMETPFALEAILINDNGSTTVERKIELLTKLCQDHGYFLKVINKPNEENPEAT